MVMVPPPIVVASSAAGAAPGALGAAAGAQPATASVIRPALAALAIKNRRRERVGYEVRFGSVMVYFS
jgi:hypothetical protein